jgi:hypothetical protein
MESIDPDFYKSLRWMLDNSIDGVIDQTFSIEEEKFGETETIDLIPDGQNIAVTDENKEEYAHLGCFTWFLRTLTFFFSGICVQHTFSSCVWFMLILSSSDTLTWLRRAA